MTLLAEDVLLLLLLDRESGSMRSSRYAQPLLGGALLSELALGGRAVRDEGSGWLHRAKVHPAGAPPEDPVLAAAYATVAERERTPQDLVNRLGKGLRDRLAARLVAAGVLREEHDTLLGLIPRKRWPAAGATRDDAVGQRVAAVLVLGQEPDPRTRALVALLSAADVAHKVIDLQRVPARDVRRRAKALAEGDWAAKGVRDAVTAANAAAAG